MDRAELMWLHLVWSGLGRGELVGASGSIRAAAGQSVLLDTLGGFCLGKGKLWSACHCVSESWPTAVGWAPLSSVPPGSLVSHGSTPVTSGSHGSTPVTSAPRHCAKVEVASCPEVSVKEVNSAVIFVASVI